MKSVKEEEMQNKLVTMGFITGAIIGGVIGLLYAPKSGKETRDYLKTTAAHTKEEAYILAEHAKEVAIEKARKAKAAAEAVAGQAHQAGEQQS
jgi:gas vesicle protein